jgi:hypothetical protein
MVFRNHSAGFDKTGRLGNPGRVQTNKSASLLKDDFGYTRHLEQVRRTEQ